MPPPLMTSKARSERVRTGFGSKRARRRDAHMILGIRTKGKLTWRRCLVHSNTPNGREEVGT